jgi:hypothetical protein
MTTPNLDNEKRKLELEDKISELVKADNKCTVHFEYKKAQSASPDKLELTVTTFNPLHDEKFVLMKVTESGILKCLDKVVSYLEHHKRFQSSYTVLWSEKAKFMLNTSYFYAYDMQEVLNRFFEGKDRHAFIIYEMKLNPIS